MISMWDECTVRGACGSGFDERAGDAPQSSSDILIIHIVG